MINPNIKKKYFDKFLLFIKKKKKKKNLFYYLKIFKKIKLQKTKKI